MRKTMRKILILTGCLLFAFGTTGCMAGFGEEIALNEGEIWQEGDGLLDEETPETPSNPENPDDGGDVETENPDDGGDVEPEPEPTEPVVLSKPSLEYVGGEVCWKSVDGASYYEYKFAWTDEPITTTDEKVEMGENELVYVRAVGDGENYETSEWTSCKKPNSQILAVTGVVVNNDGLVTWVKNQYAVKYVYKLYEDGEELDSDGSGVQRYVTYDEEGNPIYDESYIWIKAIGNGTSYTDSDWVCYQYMGPNSEDDSYV